VLGGERPDHLTTGESRAVATRIFTVETSRWNRYSGTSIARGGVPVSAEAGELITVRWSMAASVEPRQF